jgi:aminopeptidase N
LHILLKVLQNPRFFPKIIFSLLHNFYNKNMRNMKKALITCTCLFLFAVVGTCQFGKAYTKEDTLRGSITPERVWWDLSFYDLKVSVNPAEKYISGSNTIHYKVLSVGKTMQIDLQPPLSIDKIEQDGKVLDVKKEGKNAYMVSLQSEQKMGARKSLTIYYKGKPRVANNAPWDGGFSWSKDKKGNPFVATSCQGLGSSIWWPCKDHMYDEPDSMSIAVTVPKGLMDVSNGILRKTTENNDGTTTYNWYVKNPINNYGVNVNIGDYVHFSEEYAGEKGKLAMDYYVLRDNLAQAKTQFKQAGQMMKAFEHWFGPYPFYEDGYKLVEVPYLGMEHQSSVTYGNQYKNGYLGQDLSGSGWGNKWDFIIVHESGHEWFANNITYKDIADMWVHEGFTAYSECLFTEYYYGRDAGAAYVIGTRMNIQNDKPVIGKYNVNEEGSQDMYYKGSNMLHTIRQIVDNDAKWRDILRGLNKDFYHQTVTTQQIEQYIIQKSGKKLQKAFDQYLRDTKVPHFDYKLVNGTLTYRWSNCIADFDMPIKVALEKNKYYFIYPTTEWKTVKIPNLFEDEFKVDVNFYVEANKL